ARYLQWKAVLSGKQASPILTSVTAAYLQRNLRPRVTSLTVHPSGTVFQKPYPTGDPDIAGYDDQTPDRRVLGSAISSSSSTSGSGLGRRAYQRGLQTFVWRADRNDFRVGYHFGSRRYLFREDRGFRRSVESARFGASGRARERRVRHR